MNLPELSASKLQSLLQKDSLREKLILQISKDLEMSGLELGVSETEVNYNSLLRALKGLIEPLFVKNNQKLFSMLYRIDVSEKEIALAGSELPDYNHVEIISHVIIRREVRKVLIREYYSG